jgi:hypothetical protein
MKEKRERKMIKKMKRLSQKGRKNSPGKKGEELFGLLTVSRLLKMCIDRR